jgi:hypothetical protein
MIHLRCPHHGCPIDVADDMLGARIRCPHCSQLLFVEPEDQEAADPPPVSHEIAEGMPPLAAMLGIREGRGARFGESRAVHANMTNADWQALVAFEKLLDAAGALQAAIGFGIAVALLTLFSWWAAAATADSAAGQVTAGCMISRSATLLLLAVGFVLMALGRRWLRRVRLGARASAAALAALAVAAVFVANALVIVEMLLDSGSAREPAGPALLLMPLQLAAAILAVRACLWTRRAQLQASLYTIRHRLIAALEYLDWVERENRLLKDSGAGRGRPYS